MPYTVTIVDPDAWVPGGLSRTVDVHPDEGRRTFVVPDSARPTSSILVRFEDVAGVLKPHERVVIEAERRTPRASMDAEKAGEIYRTQLLPAGEYRLVVSLASSVILTGDWFALAQGSEHDAGVLRSEALGSMRVEVSGPRGRVLNDCYATLFSREREQRRSLARDGAVFEGQRIVPGVYRLELWVPGYVTRIEDVEIVPGEELSHSLTLVKGRHIGISVPRPRAAADDVVIRVRGANGDLYLEQELVFFPGGEKAGFSTFIAPAACAVELWCAGKLLNRKQLAAGGEDGEQIEIKID